MLKIQCSLMEDVFESKAWGILTWCMPSMARDSLNCVVHESSIPQMGKDIWHKDIRTKWNKK